MKIVHCLRACLVFALLASFPATTSRANVYATDIRLNGARTNAVLTPGGSVAISYILNEPGTNNVASGVTNATVIATNNVTIAIKSGGTAVRTIHLDYPNPGTRFGSNVVTWDGKDNASNAAPGGTYSVEITAASMGYTNWTQVNSRTSTNYHLSYPTGIAVNRNTNSPYYGRVFISNGQAGFDEAPGDQVGIIKANADGTFAEGGFSDGGWLWGGDAFSPWKIEVSADDYVYVNDWNLSTNGVVVRFDQAISTNSQLQVLRADNWPNGGDVLLSGLAVSGQGAATKIWMTDINTPGVGIRRWDVTASGVIATNNTGTTIVKQGDGSQLDDSPYDVALDASNHLYTIQFVNQSDSPTPRVLRFSLTNSAALSNADWMIGTNDDSLLQPNGIAVDPSGKYLGVAIRGTGTGGSLQVFATSNGAPVATLQTGDEYMDVAWDNAGNIYAVVRGDSSWQVYSPPGTNSATTLALNTIQVPGSASLRPLLTNSVYATALKEFQFLLVGEANAAYVIEASTNLASWNPVLTNTAASASRPITIPAPAAANFYRAVIKP